ncbi:MAG: glycosyltransferase family 4 protein [Planctomycetes bacterium]|nr:glycosyltransferase family 4 protein [Planctomycetota bacterium]
MSGTLVVASDLGLRAGPAFAPGGLQSMGRMIVRALVDSLGADEVTAWSLLDEPAVVHDVLPAAVGLSQVARGRGLGASTGFAGSKARLAWSLLRRRRAFGRVLFVHVGVGALSRLLPRGRHGLCLVGIEAWQPLEGGRRACVEGARPLLSISAHTAQRMKEINPWAPEATVVHLGLEPDPPWARPVAAPASRHDDGAPTAVTVGRLSAADAYKGYDKVIASWPLVVQRVPEARLLVVGDGDDQARLKELSRGLPRGVGESISFLGRLDGDQLQATYAASDAFVLPSTGEGFGLVHLEAMRAGLPCVCSHDASSEIVVDGSTGFVVDPTPDAVGPALARLLGNRDEARRMGEAGRARLHAEFTYEAFRERFVAAWQDADRVR